jgi:protein-S-isoprenylcysteine O-methyltransferase Ste14
MSLVPAFEIGLWNAWILAIALLLFAFVPSLVLNDYDKKMGGPEGSGKGGTLTNIFFFILVIYAIFLPVKLGTVWFYTGLLIYILGLMIISVAIANAATTPLGKPFTKGVYRYSRNPMYLSMIIVFIGIGIASASWLYLLLLAVMIVLIYFAVAAEERYCLERYGLTYREYMNRTPRWLGIDIEDGNETSEFFSYHGYPHRITCRLYYE